MPGRKRRLLIYLMLFLLLLINYLDRIAISIAGSTISKDFHIGPVALGYLYSSSLWIYMLCLLPAGLLVDRLGTRRVVAFAIGFWSICQMLCGMAWGVGSLMASRIGLGVFESPTNAAGNRAIREWSPREERGSATSAFIMGAYAGPAIGAPFVAWLVTRFGWREAFLITGLAGLVWLCAWLTWFRQPEEARWLGDTEREHILRNRDIEIETAVDQPQGPGFRELFSSPSMWGLALAQGCMTYTQYLFLTWFPSYLQHERGLTIIRSGIYTAIPYAVTVVGCLVISWLVDRLFDADALRAGKRRYAITLFLLLSADILAAPLIHSTTLIIVLFSTSMLASACAMSWNFALTNDLLQSPSSAGRAFALLTLGGNVFGIIAPIATGYIVNATGRFDSAFMIAGVLLLVGAVLVLFFTRRPLGIASDKESLG